MRDYLSPAKRAMARVMPHPAAVRAFVMKRRAFVFIMAATFVVITTLGFVSVRALVVTESANGTVKEDTGERSTLTSVTTDSQPTQTSEAVVEGDNSSLSVQTPTSTSESETTVTVNDQAIAVPQNGTTHKTIVSGDGTTNVTVSTSSGSENSSSTVNSYSSTNSSSTITSNTFSHEMNISH